MGKRTFSQRLDRRLEIVRRLGLAHRKLSPSQRKYVRRKMAEVKINEKWKTPVEEEKERVNAIQEKARQEEQRLHEQNIAAGAQEGGPGKDYWRGYHSRRYNRFWDGELGKELGQMMVSDRGLYREYFIGLPKTEIKTLRRIVNKARQLRLAAKKGRQQSAWETLTPEERKKVTHALLGALGLNQ